MNRNFILPINLSYITILFFIGFVLLLVFFNYVDVYHQYFFSKHFIVIIYNITRISFIFYIIWIFYATGHYILKFTGNSDLQKNLTLEMNIMAFIAGVGVWQILLFFIGLAGFYNRHFISLLTILILIASLPKLNQWITFVKMKNYFVYWPGLIIFLFPIFIFLIVKGLYPGGGNDYYNHYFPYYRAVVDHGNIWPNEVWYHIFYSKGAGLFFLSMLLTDSLAPQLVTTALMVSCAAMIFDILKKFSKSQLLPWIGAALYIGFLIYTPGPLENSYHGGWANLEKSHEPSSVLMFSIIWLSIGLCQAKQLRGWGIALILAVSSCALINPMTVPIICAYLFVVIMFFYFSYYKKQALWILAAGFTAFVWFIFLFGVNFILTGIADDQFLLLSWPFINFDKVKSWGVLIEILGLHSRRMGMLASQIPLTKLSYNVLTYLRLDVWGPLLVFAIVLVFINLLSLLNRSRMFKKFKEPIFYLFALFLLIFTIISIFVGCAQAISYYRFSIISYAPMLCFCLLIISACINKKTIANKALIIIFCSTWLALGNLNLLDFKLQDIKPVLVDGVRFMIGEYSIADAYRNNNKTPGTLPWGAIYPGAEAVWSMLPSKTRIWSMHIHSYCMLPDCHMERVGSFRFSPHADKVYYGNPLEAKEWLQKEKLNYFFFSTALSLSDILPLSPLFSPEHIANYLGIAWSNGVDTLLTWKEQTNVPIDTEWLQKYKESIEKINIKNRLVFNEVAVVLENTMNKTRIDISDLPWMLVNT